MDQSNVVPISLEIPIASLAETLPSLMVENAKTSNLQLLKTNCSDVLVKSHPDDVVKELGKQIIILYFYAAFVVAATFMLYLK